MSKGLRLLSCACMLLLGGCALPLPVQIAKWSIDGLLLVTTEKTTADHGMSLIVQRDCAMLRVVTEGSLCRDDAVTMIASADTVPPEVASDAVADAGADAAERLASFATAAGGVQEPAPLEARTLEAKTPEAETLRTEPIETVMAVAAPEPAETAAAAPEHWLEQWTEHWLEQRAKQWAERWNAILDTALFIHQLARSPAPAEALLDVQWHIEGLYLGDAGLDLHMDRPSMDGTYAETVLGGAGDDSLASTPSGRTGRDQNPEPIMGDDRRHQRGQARTRRARRLAHARGRGPPGRHGHVAQGP